MSRHECSLSMKYVPIALGVWIQNEDQITRRHRKAAPDF